MSTFTIPFLSLVTSQLPAMPNNKQSRVAQGNPLSVTHPALPVQKPAPLRESTQNSSNRETGAPAQRVGANGNSLSLHSSSPQLDDNTHTIYGSSTVSPPTVSYSLNERKQRLDAYADRVKAQIGNIEQGREGERNIKFQNARQFLEPSGFFSAGLLAAGYDPHEKITVTFDAYRKEIIGNKTNHVSTEKRTYLAWELAAGALAHDKVAPGGPINFQYMSIQPKDRSKVDALEGLGKNLQDHWEKEIATPMRDASGGMAQRSGKADAYLVKGTLQSLVNDKTGFESLSPAGQAAVKRTLAHNGQVIIPNVYGYPLAGYAFIPNTPYDANYEHRPNQGLMIDLRKGSAHEIQGDEGFANWATTHRDDLLKRFNARDRQGGKDAHWPKAGEVLDSLIAGNDVSYEGYFNLVSDQAIPVRETFNYTRSRNRDYSLREGSLEQGLASQYQAVNTKNSVWADQTQVFGASQQSWKSVKEAWGNTFGYLPVVGNAGNIVFGIHDGIYGKTADDRLQGNAAAVISGLQLAHELLPGAVETGLGDTPSLNTSAVKDYSWTPNEQTHDLELRRPAKALNRPVEGNVPVQGEPPTQATSVTGAVNKRVSNDSDINRLRPGQAGSISDYAVPNGEALIENTLPNGQGIYQLKNASGVDQWFIRHTDTRGAPKVYEIRSDFKIGDNRVQIIDPATRKPLVTVSHTNNGDWIRTEGQGGSWPWRRSSSPTTPVAEERPASPLAAKFEVEGLDTTGAEKLDEYLKFDKNIEYDYGVKNTRQENGVVTQKQFQLSWQVEEDNFMVTEGERARPNHLSDTDYSHNFLLDLDRNYYSVINREKPELNMMPDAEIMTGDEFTLLKLRQFEAAIPDPLMRTRISEVAHQGATVHGFSNVTSGDAGLKGDLLPSGRGLSFIIDYDPVHKAANVNVVAKNIVFDVGDEIRQVPDVDFTVKRTYTIREGNEIGVDSNPYVIDKHAPSTIEFSLTTDV
ncbi:hypothetical protein [Pseudomonas weihenstephanensis]|uniref:hypothetical protein n=1 Tax=Pseudomonas weihenstephanensis TaxID=1608994 RepID=UPI001EED6CC8|nr:hypothetical protein [Pseudomonas weihenstephanensis]